MHIYISLALSVQKVYTLKPTKLHKKISKTESN